MTGILPDNEKLFLTLYPHSYPQVSWKVSHYHQMELRNIHTTPARVVVRCDMLLSHRNNNKCRGDARREPETVMRNNPSATPPDFDAWSALARSDPRAFEECRDRVINEAILRAPEHKQQRLRRMQWKLNQIRCTSRTPMIACLRMNRMLWEAVIGDRGLLDCLRHPERLRRSPDGADTRSARIIPFGESGQV